MSKALMVGGSNGIGLAISKCLVSKGYDLKILDLKEPEAGILPKRALNFDREEYKKMMGE